MYPQQSPYQPHPPQRSAQYPHPQQGGRPPTPGGPSTGGYPQPTARQPWPLPPPAPRKKRRKWPWIVGLLVALLLILIVAAAGSRGTGSSTPTTSSPSTNASSRASGQAAAPARPAAPPRAISARDWAKIAKNPDAHTGEALIVYGQVQQFDTNTGVNAFRANVDGLAHKVEYGYVDYETNTFMDANGADLGELVQGDLFKAEVVVGGSLSYQTSLGGQMTVPLLKITKITVTGSAK
jgi:hypothetical protein